MSHNNDYARFVTILLLAAACFIAYSGWKYLTGRTIVWVENTSEGPVAHYSDRHTALCEKCKGGDEDMEGFKNSWECDSCVPITEPLEDFTPVDSNSDTGI